jgi:hypothetical protein
VVDKVTFAFSATDPWQWPRSLPARSGRDTTTPRALGSGLLTARTPQVEAGHPLAQLAEGALRERAVAGLIPTGRLSSRIFLPSLFLLTWWLRYKSDHAGGLSPGPPACWAGVMPLHR